MKYFLYLIHEAPIKKPYYCKVGITNNPIKRLAELQAGNPRALRCWEQIRRPKGRFGFPFPNKEYAYDFEQKLLNEFDSMGIRLRQDYDYQRDRAAPREWIEGIHPQELWSMILRWQIKYLEEHNIFEASYPSTESYKKIEA